jgi:UDP-N-acetylmuramoyl-tripeptide--D-alanyl-D-alanine ligase
MSALWTLDALKSATGARLSGAPGREVLGISIDSRTIAPGEVFFAIKGDRVDGHEYVAKALERGAAVAVVAEDRLTSMPANAPLAIVPDVLDALRALARAARERSAAKVIAVTGSAGKTGTKDALRLALSREGETHASTASFNNHWGVPLSLARLPSSVRFAVFELGMNHAGEIEPLAKLVRPHVAVITTIEAVHLEFFSGIEAIADAKAEIFLGLEAGGSAVLPSDNSQFGRLASAARAAKVGQIVGFGEDQGAEARLVDVALKPDCSTVRARILGDDVTYKVGAPGKHLVLNSLAVLAAVKIVGGDLAMAALALADLVPPTGRGRRVKLDVGGGKALLIDESYNANPASMEAALQLLRDTPVQEGGRRIAVLGDMLEMGQFSEKLHRELAKPVREAGVDLVCLAGPEMKHLQDELGDTLTVVYRDTAGAMADYLVDAVSAGDVVMIKSSLGIGFGRVVKALLDKYPALPDSGRKD